MKALSHYLTAYLLRISTEEKRLRAGAGGGRQTLACARGEEFVVTESTDGAQPLVAVRSANEIGREDG